MDAEIKKLKDRADKSRILYKKNLISREEAESNIMPYINEYNRRTNAIARKYKMSPKYIKFQSYIR